MAFTKTFIIKKVGNSKTIYLPADWGVDLGDMMTVQATIDGKDFTTTTKAHKNCSIYLFIPAFWPCSFGDMIDLKVTYANVPVNLNTRKRKKKDVAAESEPVDADSEGCSDADPGTED